MAAETLKEAEESLRRIQEFDTSTLSRREELGERFSFDEVIAPAKRVISIFQKVPLSSLSEFPDPALNQIKQQSNAFYDKLNQILKFDPEVAEPANVRQHLINAIINSYNDIFAALSSHISYAVSQTVDFQRLETEGQATLQEIKDKTREVVEELEKLRGEADEIVEAVRRAAADQGVSQQAQYFAKEAESEGKEAKSWKTYTSWWAAALVLYGIIIFFFHKWSVITPNDTAESIIFVTSKILIFAVLSYMLILSARNFMSHKHNATVNRHRQNALLTFQALVKAGSTGATQDIILNHASACIFAPQDTGYTKHGGANSGPPPSGLDLLPRPMMRLDGGSGG